MVIVPIVNCFRAFRSTFYYHVRRLAAPDRYQSARALVLKIYHQHKGRYGYRRIRLACRNAGVLLNGKTVRKLMKELGISSLIRVKNTVHIKENKDEFAIIS